MTGLPLGSHGRVVHTSDGAVECRMGPERLRIEAWGPDALRVRVARGTLDLGNDHGLLPLADSTGPADPADRASPADHPSEVRVVVSYEPNSAPEPSSREGGGPGGGAGGAEGTAAEGAPGGPRVLIRNGALIAELTARTTSHLQQPDLISLRFLRRDGSELLAETPAHHTWPPARHWRPGPGGLHHVAVRFRGYGEERLYGLGQHSHGLLDHKGTVTDLTQRNGDVSIPFLLSSRGYGFLWNNPAVGRVELGRTATRWVADATDQVDYWVCAADTPDKIISAFTQCTGRPPKLPSWASGFWQSKLRYRSQAEVLDVVEEFGHHRLPLSVLVVDYGHWEHLGDFRFDPEHWPDPAGMVEQLAEAGVRVMVSLWPMTTVKADTFQEMEARGYLLATTGGAAPHTPFVDVDDPARAYLHVYDATDADARRYVWERLRRGYADHGIEAFWLDADEPEMLPGEPESVEYAAGPGLAVANRYPADHARMVYEGLRALGRTEVLSLNRSAWVGAARYGAAVWSGDIAPTWGSLASSIPAGLSIGLSGIPWWTTDIGGFGGGDPSDPDYQELVVRWFQFGVFCPLFRLHGFREPIPDNPMDPGGPNEPWSFGERAYPIIRDLLLLRERLRPYVHEVAREASATGLPMMRPLFLSCPQDRRAWEVADEFLLGDELLVAPVLAAGATERKVYLPERPDRRAWVDLTDPQSPSSHAGGRRVRVPAALDRVPVFVAAGADVAGAITAR